jgi:hypothetical protein
VQGAASLSGARGLRVSQELAGCEYVDFRGAFAPALAKLISRLERNPEPATAVERGLGSLIALPLPPWVVAISLALMVPLIRCGVLSSLWKSQTQPLNIFGVNSGSWVRPLVLMTVFVTAWFFGLSFLRRRMGMMRLVTCLVFIFVACSLTLWLPLIFYSVLYPDLAKYGEGAFQATIRYWSRYVLDVAIPLSGLVIVLLIRPEDLLRWTPTGMAWNWYRTRCGSIAPVVHGPSAFEQVAKYNLSYDPMDEPAANQLRGIFTGLNARETQDSENTTSVLLLTNRTRTEWLLQQTKEQQRTKVLTVVGTSIGLRESLDWLWQRQWIDYRRWNLKEVRKSGLLQVPEALSSPCFPIRVRLSHHLLCALATMSVLLADTSDAHVALQVSQEPFWKQATDFLGVIGFYFMFIFCGVLARRLLRRRISQVGFFRAWIAALLVMSVMSISFYKAAPNSVSWVKTFAGVLFLIIFPILMVWNQHKLAFWFPLRDVAHKNKADELTAQRNWQTLIWLSVYTVFWLLVQIVSLFFH